MGANNMFIDGVVGAVGLCMAAKSIITHNPMEAFIWTIITIYGVANYFDRKLAEKYED